MYSFAAVGAWVQLRGLRILGCSADLRSCWSGQLRRFVASFVMGDGCRVFLTLFNVSVFL
ncbi:hypothetical protein N7457_004879 [Penicillium paradoxum]|uniref:uncharacterized protein n=1 Tax=Penicillium paradoxum TaxID=176176 RepID=UPI00254720F3|nr:uncharacterized protein N7457_004879 [Penicillium paradoxum]KAJ5783105.1 hypothetical protein N7457_004879 [Penicillium paradoxum]